MNPFESIIDEIRINSCSGRKSATGSTENVQYCAHPLQQSIVPVANALNEWLDTALLVLHLSREQYLAVNL